MIYAKICRMIKIPYKYDHAEHPEDAIKDFVEYMKIITKAKSIKLHIIPISLNN